MLTYFRFLSLILKIFTLETLYVSIIETSISSLFYACSVQFSSDEMWSDEMRSDDSSDTNASL